MPTFTHIKKARRHDGPGFSRQKLWFCGSNLSFGGARAGNSTRRVGLSEDLANVRLMNVVQALAVRYPLIAFSVRVGISADLLHAMDQGELDVAIGGRCSGARAGRVLWREPLVWAGAEWASHVPGAPVPLALLPEPCPYREAALAALARAGVDYRIAFVCSSGAGLSATALAGFAVTPIVHSQLVHGLHVIPPDTGLPALPDVEFTMFDAASPSAHVAEELGNAIALAFGHKNGVEDARRNRSMDAALPDRTARRPQQRPRRKTGRKRVK
jgi:DNA-binding transcriptional LysR family regulator